MKKSALIVTIAFISILVACGTTETKKSETADTTANSEAGYDLKKGEGKWTAENLQLTEKINETMAAEGAKIQEKKCVQCHKTTDETLVGPGWKGVLTRRTPEWIMNFITNPEGMIDKDPQLKAMWEKCYVRMPDLNLTDAEARKLLEFLRKNDAVQN